MKDVEVDYLYSTASQLIHKNRCHLVGILITPLEDERTYADIYDGINTTEPKMMRVRTDTEASKFIEFSQPVLMQRGIYVSIPDKVESYTIFWKPIED